MQSDAWHCAFIFTKPRLAAFRMIVRRESQGVRHATAWFVSLIELPCSRCVSRRITILLLTLLSCFFGCDKSAEKATKEAVKPAKVEKLPVETDLARITLTADADRRLGIATTPVSKRSVTQRRTLGGMAVVPSGKSIVVTAPLAGSVSPPSSQAMPVPGAKVDAGRTLLLLTPLLSAERDVPTPAERVQLVGARATLMSSRTVAEGDVERITAEVEAARIALDRARKLFADRAGPRGAVEDAEAQLNIAASNLKAAQDREKQLSDLLKMLDISPTEGEATALPMTTPIGGLINRLEVSNGQTVASGAVLFEVVNTDVLWIRVPVFVDLLAEIQTNEPAQLAWLSGESFPQEIIAKPVAAPPTADPLSSSADLYYEVDNRELKLRPGQRVGVRLPVSTTETALVVPEAAILYDVYGNTWVYTKTADHEYTRRRVSIRFTDGDEAVLATGPALGTPVVTGGAAELFGTEFGAGK
ncbi:MAG: efflux RND transporter periplasmic adaptor subunit [Planctomycetaceae bacterium]